MSRAIDTKMMVECKDLTEVQLLAHSHKRGIGKVHRQVGVPFHQAPHSQYCAQTGFRDAHCATHHKIP